MGRSLNTVFARLANEKLKPNQLEDTAKGLGFGTALPFDVPVHASALKIPEDQLGFARTAAGFWNTTLSPIHAAWLSAAIARGGEPVRPTLVAEIADEDGKAIWTAPNGLSQKRVMKSETAHAVSTMMDSTVSDGTSYRAFHDGKGRAFLPGVAVAGKTGTLTDPQSQRFYTWFTGFAPSKPIDVEAGKDQPRQVAFGVLVVNDPQWSIKANVLAREVLRAYFAGQHVPNVSMPTIGPGTRSRDEKAAREKEKTEKAEVRRRGGAAAHRIDR
jgi:penicillin-binding protein A